MTLSTKPPLLQRQVIRSAHILQSPLEVKLIFYTDLRLSNRKLAPMHMASSKPRKKKKQRTKQTKKLLALPALQVRRKKAFQKAARAGQSRSVVRPAVTESETTCAQWRAGFFNLVVGMGEASGLRGLKCRGARQLKYLIVVV